MKSYNIILIQIICLFSSFIFSQTTPKELMIKREIETLREEAKNSRALSGSAMYQLDLDPEYIEDYADTLVVDENINQAPISEHYGYNILTNFSKRIIWDNQPASGEYMLGTGDEVIIEIWGDTQLRSVHTIDRYGKINIDKIGQINLSAVALNDLKSKLISKFQNVYSSLKGPDATAYLDISLGKLKSINVTFIGECVSPGIHAIHPFSTIITGLMQTGGIKELGSLRDIQIIRNGKKITSLDFYDYLSNGNAESDRRLLDGDVLFIPIRYSTISIEGEIMRPSKYELLPNETLDDIIHYSGGLTAVAQSLIRVHRSESVTELSTTHIINFYTQPTFILKNGDTIEVYGIPGSDHQVYVYGQVKKTGSFAFDTEKENSLLDILVLAGVMNDETYQKRMYTNIGEIIRNTPDTYYPDILEFNLEKLISGDLNEDKILQNMDIILIRENPNFRTPEKVSILGEVIVPGIYTLIKKGETIDDLLKRSGGFSDKAFQNGLQLHRNNSQVALENFDLILLDGDSLMVPRHSGIIEVVGEVHRSGYIQYNQKKSLKDYIENAGGFTEYSDEINITVISANGDVTINKRFRNPKITEGSTIIVHFKAEQKQFDFTEFSTNMASLITSIATLYLLLDN